MIRMKTGRRGGRGWRAVSTVLLCWGHRTVAQEEACPMVCRTHEVRKGKDRSVCARTGARNSNLVGRTRVQLHVSRSGLGRRMGHGRGWWAGNGARGQRSHGHSLGRRPAPPAGACPPWASLAPQTDISATRLEHETRTLLRLIAERGPKRQHQCGRGAPASDIRQGGRAGPRQAREAALEGGS